MRPTHPRTDRDLGFTLVELMIAMVASAIVIAGAFALNISFARQNERLKKVADVQETLRVARQYVEKQLRLAGTGFGSGTFKVPMYNPATAKCEDVEIGGVEFHNLNDYPIPVVDIGHESEFDPDPDWFQFAYMNVDQNPASLDHWASAQSVEGVINNAQAIADYPECSSMISLGKPGQGTLCVYGLKKVQGQASHININPNGCKDNPCMDTSKGIPRSADDCLCNDGISNPAFPSNPDFIQYLSDYKAAHPKLNYGQAYRQACDAYSKGMPILIMGPGLSGIRLAYANESLAWAPPGSAASAFGWPMLGRSRLRTSTFTWDPLTDMIEDIQFEVFLSNGTTIGTLMGGQMTRRDVTKLEWGKMRAVRYTLVARSRTPVESAVGFQQSLPSYADRPACPRLGSTTVGCPYTDGHVRRMVQGVVQLRNYGL